MTEFHHDLVEKVSPTNRSRVTNARLRGKISAHSLFVDGDGRTPWARRYRDLVGLLCDDAGGLAVLTELKLSLIRRAAALILECERMENALADGEKIDVDLLARLSSHVRRISESIGIERAKRDITPSLAELIAGHQAAKPAERAKPLAATPAATASSSLASEPPALADHAEPLDLDQEPVA